MAIGCAGGTTEACVPLPCPLPLAVTVQVTSRSTGTVVDSVSMQVSGPMSGSGPCPGSVCVVLGTAGTYSITVSAPGYQPAHLDVIVHGVSPQRCGCATVDRETRSVALDPIT